MKRFDITGSDGRKFSVQADVLPPLHPDWGVSPRIVETDLTTKLNDEAVRRANKIAALARLRAAKGQQDQLLNDILELIID